MLGKNKMKRLIEQKYLFLLLLPALIWVIFICYAPMTGLYMAFINYTPRGEGYFKDMINSKFVGFDWFRYFFETDFSKIMRNTVITSVFTIIFSFPLPIILAISLQEIKNIKLKSFVQTVSYLPYFISWVIASNIFISFLSTDGVINDIFVGLGVISDPIPFFQRGPYFWVIIAIANTWKNFGYSAIIYLASIANIDKELYEAAWVEGANRWQRIKYITLPGLKSVTLLMLIIAVGNVLNTGFEQHLLMGNDSILDYSDVLDTYSYRYGLKNGMYSYGTAVGLFKSVFSFVLVIIANRITKYFSDDGEALF